MGNTPEIVSKLQFLYHLEENKLELGEAGGVWVGGGWGVGNFLENFRKLGRNFPENSEKIPENGPDLLKFTEIYWNYWNFEITENSVQLNFTEIYWNFQTPSKLFPLTEITEIEITNLVFDRRALVPPRSKSCDDAFRKSSTTHMNTWKHENFLNL